jgi:glycosyltransferase involved in cell wall biosynthesis
MHVLWLCQTYPPDPGGLAKAARRISQGLRPQLSSLRILRLDKSLPPGQAQAEGDIWSLGPLPDEDETCQLVEQLLVHLGPLDLIHCFYAGSLACAGVAAGLRRGCPQVVSLRGNDLDRGIYRSKGSAQLQWLLKKATAITCLSREQQHKLARWFDRQDGHYIPNSVDTQEFFPDQPLSVGLPEGPLLMFFGEMRWKKGLHLLSQVVEQAQSRFRIVLVGGVRGGPCPAEVIRLPYRDDPAWLRGLYARAEVVWLPAFWEGCPNTILEAMACARPILAHAVGGVADLLDEQTGWTLALSELDQTAQRVLEICENPGHRGEAARQHVQIHHQPTQETKAYLSLYRDLLQACSA